MNASHRFHLVLVLLTGICMIGIAQTKPLDLLLLKAVKSNNFDSVKLLVDQGADVNFRDTNQAPVVMWAALKGDLTMVKYLVSKGADVKKKGIIINSDFGDYRYGNISGIAVTRKDLPMLKFLFEDCGIPYNDKELDRETKTETGWEPLTYALWEPDTSIISYLVNCYKNLTPLELFAIGSFMHVNFDNLIIKQLNAYKADDLKTNVLTPLLFYSIQDGNISFLKKLLDFKPDLNILNKDSVSPLSLSIALSFPEIAKLLVDKGAPIHQTCYDRKTALFFAAEIGDSVLFDYLLQNGALINQQDTFGRTPLFYSILLENLSMAKFILSRNADASICTFDQDYPEMLASTLSFTEFAGELQRKTTGKQLCQKKNKPQLLIPPAKSGFYDFQVSEDKKYFLATSSGFLYIWDLSQRKLLRVYRAPDDNFYLFKHLLFSTNTKGNLECFSIVRNERVKQFPYEIGPKPRFSKYFISNSIVFPYITKDSNFIKLSEDGYWPDQVFSKKSFQIATIQKYKSIETLNGDFQGASNDLNLIGISQNGTIKIFNRTSSKTYNVVQEKPFINDTIEGYFHDIAISNDGKFASLGSLYLDNSPNERFPTFDSVNIINIGSKRRIVKLSGRFDRMSFSDDGKYFAVVLHVRNTFNYHFYIFKQKSDSLFEKVLERDDISDFKFSSDNETVYLGTDAGYIYTHNLYTKKNEKLLSGDFNVPLSVYSDSTNNITICSNKGSFISWDLSKGNIADFRNLKESMVFNSFMYGNDGSYGLAQDSSQRNLLLVDLKARELLTKCLLKSKSKFENLYWYTLIPDRKIFLFSSKTRLNIISISGDTLKTICPLNGYTPQHHSISSDGKLFALSSGYDFCISYEDEFCKRGAFCVINLQTLDTLYSVKTSTKISDIKFSADNQEIWVALDSGRIDVYSFGEKQARRRIIIPDYPPWIVYDGFVHYENYIHFLYSPSSANVFIKTLNKVYIIDPVKFQIIKEATSERRLVIPTLSNKNKWLVYPSAGGSTKIWDIESNKEVCTLFCLDSLDYVVRTPNGLFDASPGAMKKMSFAAGMEVLDLDQLKHRYYQPGLLPILLGQSNEKLREVPAFDYVKLFPEINLAVNNTTLNIKLKNRGGGIGKVPVFIDNIQVLEDARMSVSDSLKPEVTLSIDLSKYANFFRYDTTNTIRIVAWNAEGYLSSRPAAIQYTPPPASAKGVQFIMKDKNGNRPMPRLYALIVGTSDYSGEQIDLKYAAKDAEAFSNALMVGATRLFGKDHVSIKLLASGKVGAEPTMNSIRSQLDSLKKAGPDDIVVVYFSGHGVNYGGQDGMFYYLTMGAEGLDARYLNDPAFRTAKALSSQEISNSLNRIPAQKKVLILDACSSGRAADNLMASLTRDIPSSQKRALEFTQDATGAYLLASSAANTVSYESPIFEHGLLTYTLLQGMHGGQLTKIESDEYIDVEKLFMYAKTEVPRLAYDINGIQDPVLRTPGVKGSLIIGRMTEEDKQKIVLAEPKSVFLPCSFTNSSDDLTAEEIDIAERLNAKLDLLSAKGSQSEIRFARVGSYPDGYSIKGKYTIKDQEITISYILRKGAKVIGLQQSETGAANKIDELLDRIILNVGKLTEKQN